jgi:hypothetical protein
MKEIVLRQFFEGHATASELAWDLVGTVERGEGITSYRMERMAEQYDVSPRDLLRVLDAVKGGELHPQALELVGDCLDSSQGFLWDEHSAEGEIVAEVVFWWGTPEANYPLVPEILTKIRHYLVTGKNTLTLDDARVGMWRPAWRDGGPYDCDGAPT